MKTILLTTMAAALLGITARADESTGAPTNAPADSTIENVDASTNSPATSSPAPSAPTTNTTAPSVSASANVRTTSATAAPPATAGTSYLDRKFEAGAIFGEPTGASLKYWLNNTVAVDGALGWSFDRDTDFYLHSDVLWHKFDVFNVSRGRLPLYFGVGGLMKFRDDHDDIVGVRIPVGVNYLFEDAPVSLFLEVAPVLEVAPATRGDFTAGIGVRYRF